MKRFESIIFYLFIFVLPFQSRLILYKWTEPFNQWTSAYLYGTDIILAVIFILWLARNLSAAKIDNFKILNPRFFLVLFFVVSAVSMFNSGIVALSFYQLLKLAEFIGFYFYLRANLGKIFSFKQTLIVIIISGLFQSVIAIVQYFGQSSLGLRFLGESPLSVNNSGVAIFIVDGIKYLRAYGTTPHPNILAAWLFLAIFAFYNFYLSDTPENMKKVSWLLLIVPVILLWGFFFTFSRVIIGLWVLGSLIRLALLLRKDLRVYFTLIKRRLVVFVSIVVITVGAFAMIYWPQVQSRIHISVQEEAVTQRVFYNKIAESIAAAHPFFGVGIGQFVSNFMSKFERLPAAAYQPVHNVYLLIASETGLAGFAAFLLFIFFCLYNFVKATHLRKAYHFSFLIFASSFLVIGLFDHFLWTSQQGGLMLWMALALLDDVA